jgi:bacteriocin-like protein
MTHNTKVRELTESELAKVSGGSKDTQECVNLQALGNTLALWDHLWAQYGAPVNNGN